ncbi:MAG: GyrI-like domain-containing protein [candidate division FCPU426 bacterium]
MKKIIAIIGAAVAVLLLGLAGFLGYLGLFSPVPVNEREMGPYTVVFESFVGPYAQTGGVFSRLYENLKADGIETEDGIGLYYDDPRQVPAAQLRSDCACVLTPEQMVKAQALGTKYRFKTIEKSACLVAEFPIRLPMSYMIAPMKTYPALMQAAQARGLTIGAPYEYYAMKAKKIIVAAPVLPKTETESEK